MSGQNDARDEVAHKLGLTRKAKPVKKKPVTTQTIGDVVEPRTHGIAYESHALKKIANQLHNRRTALELNVGDEVEIGGKNDFSGQFGKITRFGSNKNLVVVKLHDSGSMEVFHAHDVLEAPAHEKFYVVFYEKNEHRSWIGLVTKESGGKWHEKPFKGRSDNRWGQTFDADSCPDEIVKKLLKDYSRDTEVNGPFYHEKEAKDYVMKKWGRIEENVNEHAALSPWSALNVAAHKKHGEPDFESLPLDDAEKYIDIPLANKLSLKAFDDPEFMSLKPSQMRELVNDHPELLLAPAKKFRKKKDDDLEESVFTGYADWKQAVLLSNPAQAQKMQFRGKMEGERMIISAKVPGDEKVYGEWDDKIEVGTVLNEDMEPRHLPGVSYKVVGKKKSIHSDIDDAKNHVLGDEDSHEIHKLVNGHRVKSWKWDPHVKTWGHETEK